MSSAIVRRMEMVDGIPADIWVTHEKQIGKFIKNHNITPVSRRTAGLLETDAHEGIIDIDRISGIRGGMKVPHFHYRGDIYLLKPKQWREFSAAVVEDLSRRLEDAGRVSFHELLDISSSVASIMR